MSVVFAHNDKISNEISTFDYYCGIFFAIAYIVLRMYLVKTYVT